MLSEANLNATINNTTLLVWSINRDYTLIAFNEPVKNYFKTTYGIELKQGERILKDDESDPEILTPSKEMD